MVNLRRWGIYLGGACLYEWSISDCYAATGKWGKEEWGKRSGLFAFTASLLILRRPSCQNPIADNGPMCAKGDEIRSLLENPSIGRRAGRDFREILGNGGHVNLGDLI